MLRRIIPGQHTGHGGPGQGIVNALHRGQRHSERRGLGGEQATTRIPLHHRDSNSLLLTYLIEPRPVRVDSAQVLLIVGRKIGIDVLAGREQIKRRIDAEQEHLDLSALGRQDSHLGIVRAQAYMADHASGLLLLHIGEKRSVHDPVKFRLLIHKVDHAQVEVICP